MVKIGRAPQVHDFPDPPQENETQGRYDAIMTLQNGYWVRIHKDLGPILDSVYSMSMGWFLLSGIALVTNV